MAEIEQARKIVPIVNVQNKYNITDRAHEDVVDYCEKNNLLFIPWFPLAAGSLTRPGGVLDNMAKAHNVNTSQIAIAWLLRRSPVMLPIQARQKSNTWRKMWRRRN